jgi:hypothetical protein
MNIRFYLDPSTGEPHIYGHGVTEDEVADVLRNPGEDRQDGRSLTSTSLTSVGNEADLIQRRESLAAYTI